ncbi:MAG: hypothetical protein M3O84_08555, partial [Actinomycetota bacterium]|nr:hypothetical protein [Actinomycetota bacterium]
MTTPLVLLGLAILAGAFVWLLSVRQPGSPLRPSASGSDSGFATGSPPSSAVEEPEPEPIGVMELGAPDPAPAGAAPAAEAAAPTVVGQGMESFAFVPVSASDDLDLKTRLLGVLGLI